MPRFSVLIPARNEEKYLPGCLDSIRAAAAALGEAVEMVVALNRCTDRTEEIALAAGAKIVRDDSRCMARIRNAAARAATGEIVVTIDADSRMSGNMLVEIDRLLRSGHIIGGGVLILPERWSLGILLTVLMLMLAMATVWRRVSAGLFWCRREDFQAVGGFNEHLASLEDLDFAKRLKAYGKQRGKRFKTITRAHIVTSCRKFDHFGDWYLLLHPFLVRRLLAGKSQEDADRFYYDVEH
jgi:glycosyltransferase involved in cell wall biosynthesis